MGHVMRSTATKVLIVIFLAAGVVWLKWGTLDPCTALKKDLSKMAYKQLFKNEKPATALMGGAMLGRIVNPMIDTLGAGKCVEKVERKESVADQSASVVPHGVLFASHDRGTP